MQQVDEYKFNFRLVRGAFIFAATLLTAGIVILTLSRIFYLQQQQALSQVETNLRTVRQTERETNSLESMIGSYQANFEKLSEQSYFANDGKLRWLETIKQAAIEVALIDTRYVIGQRQRMQSQNSHLQSDLGYYATPIQLDFGLLHEGDLLRVIDFFQQAELGLFSIDACRLQRVSEDLPQSASTALIGASCDFTSYSFVFDDSAYQEQGYGISMVN